MAKVNTVCLNWISFGPNNSASLEMVRIAQVWWDILRNGIIIDKNTIHTVSIKLVWWTYIISQYVNVSPRMHDAIIRLRRTILSGTISVIKRVGESFSYCNKVYLQRTLWSSRAQWCYTYIILRENYLHKFCLWHDKSGLLLTYVWSPGR